MYCSTCGKQNTPKDLYCGGCGTKLTQSAVTIGSIPELIPGKGFGVASLIFGILSIVILALIVIIFVAVIMFTSMMAGRVMDDIHYAIP